MNNKLIEDLIALQNMSEKEIDEWIEKDPLFLQIDKDLDNYPDFELTIDLLRREYKRSTGERKALMQSYLISLHCSLLEQEKK